MNLDSFLYKSKLQKGKGLFCKSEKDLIHSVSSRRSFQDMQTLVLWKKDAMSFETI